MTASSNDDWETASESDIEVDAHKEQDNTSEANATIKSKSKVNKPGQDVEHISEVLKDNPNLKFGFVVYRCCAYNDQEKWDRFFKKLRRRTRLNLQDENAEYLYNRIDWCVQEDPELAKCTEAEVRRCVSMYSHPS